MLREKVETSSAGTFEAGDIHRHFQRQTRRVVQARRKTRLCKLTVARQVTYPLRLTLSVSAMLLDIATLADEVDVEPSAVRAAPLRIVLAGVCDGGCAGA